METANPIAELISAFFFVCDNCGRDSLVRGIYADEIMEKELYAEVGVTKEDMAESCGAEAGFWMLAPVHVKCQHCGSEYQAEVIEA